MADPAPREAPRRLSYLAQLQHRLEDEVERLMVGLSSQDIKALIAWLEAKQLELAIQKSVEDNHLEAIKGSGKQEVLLELIEDAHTRLAKAARPGNESGEDDNRGEQRGSE